MRAPTQTTPAAWSAQRGCAEAELLALSSPWWVAASALVPSPLRVISGTCDPSLNWPRAVRAARGAFLPEVPA